MVASDFHSSMKPARIVITGIGLTAPNGNSLADFRRSLLTGVSGLADLAVDSDEQALDAVSLGFEHPVTAQRMTFMKKYNNDFNMLIELLDPL